MRRVPGRHRHAPAGAGGRRGLDFRGQADDPGRPRISIYKAVDGQESPRPRDAGRGQGVRGGHHQVEGVAEGVAREEDALRRELRAGSRAPFMKTMNEPEHF